MNESDEVRGDAREAELVAGVDRHEAVHRATVDDEDQTLRDLYGDADDDGIYRWAGEGPGGFDATGLAESVVEQAEHEDG